jgi:hypothetical protein
MVRLTGYDESQETGQMLNELSTALYNHMSKTHM